MVGRLLKTMVGAVFGVFATFIMGVLVWSSAIPSYAFWVEPTCDPSVDPDACNVAAPINVSAADQVKSGDLVINGAFQADTALTLSPGGTLSLPANSVTDAMVQDNPLTSSIFHRDTSPGMTDAIDLSSWHATDATGVEVVGNLPGLAIGNDWVLKVGDTMTGTLLMSLGDTEGIVIDSPATTSNNTPLDIEVTGDAQNGISVDTQATNGRGLFITATGPGSSGVSASGDLYGIEAYASDLTEGKAVYGSGTKAGVYGTATNFIGAGVMGEVTTPTTFGVIGNSDQFIGVYGNSNGDDAVVGNTGATSLGTYGVTGCKNNDACGHLGSDFLAGKFDYDTYTEGQVVADHIVETEFQAEGSSSFNAPAVRQTFAPSLGSYTNLAGTTFLESDGSEVWVMAREGGVSTQMTRLNADSSRAIAHTDFSGLLDMRGATLYQNGAYTMEFASGDLYTWDKYRGTHQFVQTITVGASPLREVQVMDFDGFNIWTGRRPALPTNQVIAKISTTTGYPASYTAGTSDVNQVIDLTMADDHLYALVDRAGIPGATTSTEVWRVNLVSNTVDRVWELGDGSIDYFGEQIIFDGQHIWVTLDDKSTSSDGLAQIDADSEQLVMYDIESTFFEFSQPYGLVYDGQAVWVALLTGTSPGRLARIKPFSEDQVSLEAPQFYDTPLDIKELTFDGEYIWGLALKYGSPTEGSLMQFVSGQGYGHQEAPASRGITIYNTDPAATMNPDVYCLYLKGSAGGLSTIADLKLFPGVCPQF